MSAKMGIYDYEEFLLWTIEWFDLISNKVKRISMVFFFQTSINSTQDPVDGLSPWVFEKKCGYISEGE